jgi:5-(carboxyamino)imidazole ribonucleotide mutase
MKQIVIIMGSESDRPHAARILSALEGYGATVSVHVASAHKQPLEVLRIIESYATAHALVYITIAGRSNALSGFTAANTTFPVLACPPFADRTDMLVNIHSTLQMPSKVPVLTVLEPENAALAAMRILDLAPISQGSL